MESTNRDEAQIHRVLQPRLVRRGRSILKSCSALVPLHDPCINSGRFQSLATAILASGKNVHPVATVSWLRVDTACLLKLGLLRHGVEIAAP